MPQTIQIVLDKELLQAADKAAKLANLNRSALIRDALREHLKRLSTLELERQDQEGYLRNPAKKEEAAFWEGQIAWPEA